MRRSIEPRAGRTATGTTETIANRAVRAVLSLGAALVLAGTALAGDHTAHAQDAGIGLPPGTPAPDAEVQDLDGNPVSLHDLIGGRPALIEFWATWCEQCEALQPEIDAVVERFGDQVAVVAVAVAVNQTPRRIRRHAEAHGAPYPFVYDARGEAVRAYEALTTAVVVLVDGEGRVVSTGVGPNQDLVGAVAELVGGG